MFQGLEEMNKVYQNIASTYEYQAPITDAGERTTYINSRSTVNVTDEQIVALKDLAEKIRNTIIGQS